VAAIGALEAGEAGSEVAATEEGLDGGDGVGAEWAEGLAVVVFVTSEEIVPAVVDDLTSSMQSGFACEECRLARRGIARAVRREVVGVDR
jgi:hypothetical protein